MSEFSWKKQIERGLKLFGQKEPTRWRRGTGKPDDFPSYQIVAEYMPEDSTLGVRERALFTANPHFDLEAHLEYAVAAANHYANALAMLEESQKRIAELEAAIREHRDAKGHDRCWLNDAELYAVLGGNAEANATLPPKCEFLQNCEAYWHNRQPESSAVPLEPPFPGFTALPPAKPPKNAP